MSKIILQLNDQSKENLKEITEAGMGFYIVEANLKDNVLPDDFIISGNYFLIPLYKDNKYFSVFDLIEQKSFFDSNEQTSFLSEDTESDESTQFEQVNNRIKIVRKKREKVNITIQKLYSRNEVELPVGYAPSAGAVSLIGLAKLSKPTLFYRYISSPTDIRLSGKVLDQGTYLTTALDFGYANTGFAAVGRYALPLPVPASHVFQYVLPKGTPIQIGTALPMFGQSGGGVEIKTMSKATILNLGMRHVDDY